MTENLPVDCLIIGAGPAGLVAATYLARYHRKVSLVDAGDSRAANIPESNNVPGFANGIAGLDLLLRLKTQAETAGVTIEKAYIETLRCDQGIFVAGSVEKQYRARSVLLATGCKDLPLQLDLPIERTWEGKVRWCPICDGYECTDKKIVLAVENSHGPAHAAFLRSYTKHLTLVASPEKARLTSEDKTMLREIGVEVIEKKPLRATFDANGGRLAFDDRSSLDFEVLYPMAGAEANSELATALGVTCNADGSIEIKARQQTNIPGLYAAGDVVSSLKQISVAMAEGAIAATAIHNDLPPNYR